MENGTHNVWHTTLDASGRVLIPAELRNEIGAKAGETLIWQLDENGVHLKAYADVISEIQQYYTSLSPKKDVWSDALISERRTEAKNE